MTGITFLISLLMGFSTADHAHVNVATPYYFDSTKGDDTYDGKSADQAWKSLAKLRQIELKPGDSVLLSATSVFTDPLLLSGVAGTTEAPIVISSYGSGRARIAVEGHLNGVLIQNSRFVEILGLDITAAPAQDESPTNASAMRCGVLITADIPGTFEHIYLTDLYVHDVFYHQPGFTRPSGEIKTANGTQSYGWGIRVLGIKDIQAYFKDVRIESTTVENVSHTGLKLNGANFEGGYGLQELVVSNCKVIRTGGPGIQISGLQNGLITGNEVDQSGSTDDSRKWGRGSGLWTWGCDRVLIEKNRFTNANGPGDSAGAHIDFNCNNVVLQYNFSANNAGGFCEILGNNYNCAYRYNISVNDGFRIKGQNGAFQEGKIFWLSGYVGEKAERHGPYNSYFYNNTIFVNKDIETKVAIDPVANGVLIVNNIFHIEGDAKVVRGDQLRPETEGEWKNFEFIFKNNLFLHASSWPGDLTLQDSKPMFGDVSFANSAGIHPVDYRPKNGAMVRNNGIEIPSLPGDSVGLVYGLKVTHDILGNAIKGKPDLGAIELD